METPLTATKGTDTISVEAQDTDTITIGGVDYVEFTANRESVVDSSGNAIVMNSENVICLVVDGVPETTNYSVIDEEPEPTEPTEPTQQYTLTINVLEPSSGSTVYIEGVEGDTYQADDGTTLSWQVEAEGYATAYGFTTLSGADETVDVSLLLTPPSIMNFEHASYSGLEMKDGWWQVEIEGYPVFVDQNNPTPALYPNVFYPLKYVANMEQVQAYKTGESTPTDVYAYCYLDEAGGIATSGFSPCPLNDEFGTFEEINMNIAILPPSQP